ncbi:DgyrCDS5140 [Dimorphilus gyrociliatus]|uniref:DgyrCDS5140 n=1 Tax=Dimorphilus gyrociliatus TaxID=2664684 RepID=A0A7I8VKJ5_9ANNE|nr:DgyrCDS5140 [Dimorphilus gyrociliatus]
MMKKYIFFLICIVMSERMVGLEGVPISSQDEQLEAKEIDESEMREMANNGYFINDTNFGNHGSAVKDVADNPLGLPVVPTRIED